MSGGTGIRCLVMKFEASAGRGAGAPSAERREGHTVCQQGEGCCYQTIGVSLPVRIKAQQDTNSKESKGLFLGSGRCPETGELMLKDLHLRASRGWVYRGKISNHGD